MLKKIIIVGRILLLEDMCIYKHFMYVYVTLCRFLRGAQPALSLATLQYLVVINLAAHVRPVHAHAALHATYIYNMI